MYFEFNTCKLLNYTVKTEFCWIVEVFAILFLLNICSSTPSHGGMSSGKLSWLPNSFLSLQRNIIRWTCLYTYIVWFFVQKCYPDVVLWATWHGPLRLAVLVVEDLAQTGKGSVVSTGDGIQHMNKQDEQSSNQNFWVLTKTNIVVLYKRWWSITYDGNYY